MKWLCIFILLGLGTHNGRAQGLPVYDSHSLLQKLEQTRTDTGRINALIRLSEFYVNKPGEERSDLDSALLLAEMARSLSRRIGYKRGEESASYFTVYPFLESRNYERVRSLLGGLSDSNRIKILLMTMENNFFRSNPKDNADSGLAAGIEALSLAKSTHSDWAPAAYYMLARGYYRLKKPDAGRSLIAEGWNWFRHEGRIMDELRYFGLIQQLAHQDMILYNSLQQEGAQLFSHYRRLTDPKEVARSRNWLLYLSKVDGKQWRAESKFGIAIKVLTDGMLLAGRDDRLSGFYNKDVKDGNVELAEVELQAGICYQMKPGEDKNDLDSALLLERAARQETVQAGLCIWKDSADFYITRALSEGRRYSEIMAVMEGMNDTLQADALTRYFMDRYFNGREPEKRTRLDSSLVYFRMTLDVCKRIHSGTRIKEAIFRLNNIYQNCEARYPHDTALAAAHGRTLMEGYRYLRSSGDLTSASWIGMCVRDLARMDQRLHDEVLIICEELRSDYMRLPEGEVKKELGQHIISIAELYGLYRWRDGDVNEGIQLERWTVDFLRSIKSSNAEPYDALSTMYDFVGNLDKALQYQQESARLLEMNRNIYVDSRPYTGIGNIYLEMGMPGLAKEYFNKALEADERLGGLSIPLYAAVARAYLMTNQPQAALDNFKDRIRSLQGNDYANVRPPDRVRIYQVLGDCYNGLGEYDKAEEYYKKSTAVTGSGMTKIEIFDAWFPIGRFYTQRGMYDLAKRYLLPLISDTARNWVTLLQQRDTHLFLFQADSAAGAYAGAISHLKQYKALNDSIFNDRMIAGIETLQLKYETEKKDQALLLKDEDLQLQDQHIKLLTQDERLKESQLSEASLRFAFENERREKGLQLLQAEAESRSKALQLARMETEKKDRDIELKEQSIQLLIKKDELQKASLEEGRLLRNALSGGAIMLVLLLGLVYNRYRLKRKSNHQLEMQQQRINLSNLQLQKLVTEKEWLMKEVHHRVKNNLQIVISLLNMQADYLQDEHALTAFGDAGYRIQAISLIHQKLYQVEDMTVINMPDYIRELVSFLEDSSTGRKRVRFELQIDPIDLDVSQSVPVGLILNEAITNSIKYAFTDRPGGCIRVTMSGGAGQPVILTIADNGKGLPPGFASEYHGSMGFQLMETLSEQLDGKMELKGEGGVSISVSFKQQQSMLDPHDLVSLKR